MVISGILSPSGIDTIWMTTEMVKRKCKRYVFGIFEYEDIKQEIWLAINKASGSYDPDRTAKATTFFNVATENALKNLRRDFSRTGEFVNRSDLPTDKLDNTFEGTIVANDMYDFFMANMPPHFKSDFEDLVKRGGANITSSQKTKIRKMARILERRYNNER